MSINIKPLREEIRNLRTAQYKKRDGCSFLLYRMNDNIIINVAGCLNTDTESPLYLQEDEHTFMSLFLLGMLQNDNHLDKGIR